MKNGNPCPTLNEEEFGAAFQAERILRRIATAGEQMDDHATRIYKRREMIVKILFEQGIEPILQPIIESGDYKGANVIIAFNGDHEKSRWIFDAHYDIDPSTTQGANDNTAAVAQLIQLATDLKNRDYHGDLMILLSDLEEPTNRSKGRMGTQVYAEQHIKQEKEFILCLDVAGNGNVACISDACPKISNRVLFKLMDEHHQPFRVIDMPESSNVGFRKAGYNATEICTLPALEVVTGLRSTWKTLHSNDDNLDRISVDTLQMMRLYLWSWVNGLKEGGL